MYQTEWCPFCRRAEGLLREKGVIEIELITIELDGRGRVALESLTGRRTVPQIYIGERHVGGCDDLQALDRAGELDALLAAA
jgi:glutaredoxin 3